MSLLGRQRSRLRRWSRRESWRRASTQAWSGSAKPERGSMCQRYSTGEQCGTRGSRSSHGLILTSLRSFKNEYGIQVKMPAKPTFPVEYLFVNVREPIHCLSHLTPTPDHARFPGRPVPPVPLQRLPHRKPTWAPRPIIRDRHSSTRLHPLRWCRRGIRPRHLATASQDGRGEMAERLASRLFSLSTGVFLSRTSVSHLHTALD